MGIALVPEGRRLFASLTVEENLLLGALRRPRRDRWTLDAVMEAFPNLQGAAAQRSPERCRAASSRRPRSAAR